MAHTPYVYTAEDSVTINCTGCQWTSRKRKSRDFAWMMFRIHAEECNA